MRHARHARHARLVCRLEYLESRKVMLFWNRIYDDLCKSIAINLLYSILQLFSLRNRFSQAIPGLETVLHTKYHRGGWRSNPMHIQWTKYTDIYPRCSSSSSILPILSSIIIITTTTSIIIIIISLLFTAIVCHNIHIYFYIYIHTVYTR